jgi:hypothetical protein
MICSMMLKNKTQIGGFMTISKQLLLIALGITMQTCIYAYDNAKLKNEVAIIQKYINDNPFATIPIFQGFDQVINISTPWLQKKLNSTYLTSDKTIIAIANAIKNNDKRTLSKMYFDDPYRDITWKQFFVGSIVTVSAGLLFGNLLGSALVTISNKYNEPKIQANAPTNNRFTNQYWDIVAAFGQ